jgi:uncharacterized membrane protein YcjF (UPF0283 family)
MRAGIGIGIVLFVLGIILAISQLWFAPWTPEIFLKVELTVAAALVIDLVVFYVVREYREDKATRSGERLDD